MQELARADAENGAALKTRAIHAFRRFGSKIEESRGDSSGPRAAAHYRRAISFLKGSGAKNEPDRLLGLYSKLVQAHKSNGHYALAVCASREMICLAKNLAPEKGAGLARQLYSQTIELESEAGFFRAAAAISAEAAEYMARNDMENSSSRWAAAFYAKAILFLGKRAAQLGLFGAECAALPCSSRSRSKDVFRKLSELATLLEAGARSSASAEEQKRDADAAARVYRIAADYYGKLADGSSIDVMRATGTVCQGCAAIADGVPGSRELAMKFREPR